MWNARRRRAVPDDEDPPERRTIDLRDRLAGTSTPVAAASAAGAAATAVPRVAVIERVQDPIGAAARTRSRPPPEPPNHADPTTPASDPTPDREPYARHDAGRVHDTSAVHDLDRVHDKSAMHDLDRVHDTSAVHDLAPVHDTGRVHDVRAVHDMHRVHDTSWVHGDPAGPELGEPPPPGSGSEPRRPRLQAMIAGGVVLAALSAAGIAAGRGFGSGDEAGRPDAAAAVSSWLEQNTQARFRVAAPASWREPLREVRPRASVVGYAQLRPTDLLVLSSGQTQELPSEQLQRLVHHSELMAAFGAGVQVRQVLGRSRVAELRGRRAAGSHVVTDLDIRLTPRAWRTLADGNVDPRLMAVLARADAAGLQVDVAGFPRDRPERAARAPARRMRVTALGGHLVDDALGGGAARMRAELLTPSLGLAPDAVRVALSPRPAVLVVAFRLRQGR